MRLWQKGIVAGALIGFIVSLFKKEERTYILNQSKGAKQHLSYYYQNPSTAIHQVRVKLNQAVTSTDKLVNQLDEIETKLEKRDQNNS
ncbi:hypothetical protein [Halalkalibacillus halophilus]|uniref:hypothetical protein n=1 Tax=Halalkalibacillus halophilus TaxID=392827 RepID=UPI000425C4B1|nr:hypothetical protein [Halalkalibacillus halophilus]